MTNPSKAVSVPCASGADIYIVPVHVAVIVPRQPTGAKPDDPPSWCTVFTIGEPPDGGYILTIAAQDAAWRLGLLDDGTAPAEPTPAPHPSRAMEPSPTPDSGLAGVLAYHLGRQEQDAGLVVAGIGMSVGELRSIIVHALAHMPVADGAPRAISIDRLVHLAGLLTGAFTRDPLAGMTMLGNVAVTSLEMRALMRAAFQYLSAGDGRHG